MRTVRWIIWIAILISIGWPVQALAVSAATDPDPRATFDSLFGAEAKRAQAAADKKEQVAFAKKLLKSAASLSDDPKLQAFVYDKAYDFASADPTGYLTARQAMDSLGEAQPARLAACDEKILTLLDRQYRMVASAPARKLAAEAYVAKAADVASAKAAAGDLEGAANLYRKAAPIAAVLGSSKRSDFISHASELDARLSTRNRVTELTRKLSAAPQDKKTAAELVVMLMVEQDDIASAAKFADASGDAALQRIAKLAAKDVDGLSDVEAADLGDWYRAQGATATPGGKRTAIGHARACYAQFLTTYSKEDAKRLKVKLALDEIGGPPKGKSKETTAAADPQPPVETPADEKTDTKPQKPAPEKPPRTVASQKGAIDLREMIDPKIDWVQGQWTVDGEDLVSDGARHSRVRIAYQPPEEYDLNFEFTRLRGEGSVQALWSRGEQGMWWEVKGTEIGRRYSATVRVRRSSVTTLLDGKVIAKQDPDAREFQIGATESVGGGALGVSSSTSPTAFHRIELVEVTGKGKAIAHGNLDSKDWRILRWDDRNRRWADAPLNTVTATLKEGVLEVKNTAKGNERVLLYYARLRAEGPFDCTPVWSGADLFSMRPANGVDSAIQYAVPDEEWHSGRMRKTDREFGVFVDDVQGAIIPYNNPPWVPSYVCFELAPQKSIRLRFFVMSVPSPAKK